MALIIILPPETSSIKHWRSESRDWTFNFDDWIRWSMQLLKLNVSGTETSFGYDVTDEVSQACDDDMVSVVECWDGWLVYSDECMVVVIDVAGCLLCTKPHWVVTLTSWESYWITAPPSTSQTLKVSNDSGARDKCRETCVCVSSLASLFIICFSLSSPSTFFLLLFFALSRQSSVLSVLFTTLYTSSKSSESVVFWKGSWKWLNWSHDLKMQHKWNMQA